MSAPTGFPALLERIARGGSLAPDDAERAFEVLMAGGASDAQIGAFLMGLKQRGETVEEITAGATVLRRHAAGIHAPEGAVDTCGTGGDGHGTINVSTAAAIVAAACGVPVAKHGNRAVSSRSGSADVLAALGVATDLTPAAVEQVLAHAGIGFLFAPRHHGAMRHVAAARSQLGFRTIFNLLGPLANPAGVKRQVVGVFDARWLEPMARVLQALGSVHVWVVHGSDGLDELALSGPSTVAELRDGRITTFDVGPADAGLAAAPLSAIAGGDAAENAHAILEVLRGCAGPHRDVIAFNAAAALIVAGVAKDLREGAAMAGAALDEGRALDVLERLRGASKAAAEAGHA